MTKRSALRLGALFAAFATAGSLGGCTQQIGDPSALDEVDSLLVNLVNPGDGKRGTDDNPLEPSTVGSVTIDVTAIDKRGQQFTGDLDVDVYLAYGGTKIGALTPCGNNEDSTPLAVIHLTKGQVKGQVVQLKDLPYGKVSVWCEVHVPKVDGGVVSTCTGVTDAAVNHGVDASPAGSAFGASQEITFRYPHIPEIQQPYDPSMPEAQYCTPFNGKQVNIVQGTGNGKLVVTSVFPSAYVVADTGALYQNDTTGGYAHLYVYSFGKPPFFIQPGRVLGKVGGNVSKFVGFTELNFPYQFPVTVDDTAQVPASYPIGKKDLGMGQRLFKLSGATVDADMIVCQSPPNTGWINQPQWIKYNTFSARFVDVAESQCDAFMLSVQVGLPGKTLGSFDPIKSIGKTFHVTGMLKNSSGQNEATTPATPCGCDNDCTANGGTCVEGSCKKGTFTFWTIMPRDASDIVLK